GARPGDPHRPLLGSALVQALALARLLGRVRPARDQTALRARHPRDLVVRSRKGGENRSVNHAEGATAHSLLCNPPCVIFQQSGPSCQFADPHVPQCTFLRVAWPVPGRVKVVGSHVTVQWCVCLQRLLFEFAALCERKCERAHTAIGKSSVRSESEAATDGG